jgi:hypothetical protein
MMLDPVARRYAEIESVALEAEQRFRADLDRLGFAAGEIALQSVSDAVYTLERDPASGDYALIGRWCDQRGTRTGSLAFHADGSFFVEQDVVRPHPSRPKWFVEALTAWGKGTVIHSEPKLLPMPD